MGSTSGSFSLGSWIVSIFIAIRFSQAFSVYLTDYIDVPSIRIATAFVILLLVALILGAMVSYLVSQIVDKTGLSGRQVRWFYFRYCARRGGHGSTSFIGRFNTVTTRSMVGRVYPDWSLSRAIGLAKRANTRRRDRLFFVLNFIKRQS